MPKFVVEVTRPVWVEDVFVVNATNEEDAAENYGNGEYIGFDAKDVIEGLDSEVTHIEEGDNPHVTFSCQGCTYPDAVVYDLIKACRAVADRWESGDLAEAARMCEAAALLAQAQG